MKIIANYEKKANIKFSQKEKSRLKADIRMFVGMKKRKDKQPPFPFTKKLNARYFATLSQILCESKEEYANCAEAVIIYDLSYEEDVKGIIKSLDLFYTDIYYTCLKNDIIQHLCDNGELDEELCYELIRKHEAPKIRY